MKMNVKIKLEVDEVVEIRRSVDWLPIEFNVTQRTQERTNSAARVVRADCTQL